MEFPTTVRTTIRPDQTVEVDEAGYNELKVQGLLVPTHEGPLPTAKRPTNQEGK